MTSTKKLSCVGYDVWCATKNDSTSLDCIDYHIFIFTINKWILLKQWIEDYVFV